MQSRGWSRVAESAAPARARVEGTGQAVSCSLSCVCHVFRGLVRSSGKHAEIELG